MNKNKIEPGQCYEVNDYIYTVVSVDGDTCWVENTLDRNIAFYVLTKVISKWRRPFNNYD